MRNIVELYLHWQAGSSLHSIARSLGMDRKTIRKYIQAARAAGIEPHSPQTAEEWARFVREQFPALMDARVRATRLGELDAHLDFIRKGLRTNCVTTIWQRLCDQGGPKVSLSTFRRYVRLVLPETLAPGRVAVWRPEVAPGEEAQVDFAYLGLWTDPQTGKRRKVWVFIMVLAYSRHEFIWPVLRLDQQTWQECHVQGFAFFEGVAQRLCLDNLKNGVVKPDLYDPQFNRSYAELAQYYGVLVDPCRVGHPKDKARVERNVTYVRESFWRGQAFGSEAEMQRRALVWCRDVAGRRIHGTTGQRPLELFEAEEQGALRPLPPEPWERVTWTIALVAQDAHCSVNKGLYSVPWRYMREQLDVRVSDKTVQFYRQDELVKTHPRLSGRGRQTDPADLPPDRIAFYQRTPRWCREQAARLGPAVAEAVCTLLAENTLVHLRQAQGILRLADTYGHKRLDAACRRALLYGDPRYRTVKTILQRGLDTQMLLDIPGPATHVTACLRGPEAFATIPVPAGEV